MTHEQPVFPEGLPRELVTLLEDTTGLTFCGGGAMDGIAAIESLGEHHVKTGEVILYTSVDSVVQLAAHEDVMPRADLYLACERARAALTGRFAVGRVIARPFDGEPGHFARTDGRRDLSRHAAVDARISSRARGRRRRTRRRQGRGPLRRSTASTRRIRGRRTRGRSPRLDELIDGLDAGIVVANLIETDQVFGHRKDVDGFHRALREIDAAVGRWVAAMRPGDLLVLTRGPRRGPRDGPQRPHARARPAARLAPGRRGTASRRPDGRRRSERAALVHGDRAQRHPRSPRSSEGGAPARLSSARCRSSPRSRRSAATSRRASRAACSSALEVLDARWCAPLRRREVADAVDGRRVERARPARQVPRLGARGRRPPDHAPADDRARCCSTRPSRRRHRACGFALERRARAALRRPAPLRHRRARARRRRRATRSSPRGWASSRSRPSFTRAHLYALDAREPARRSRRSCSTSARSPASGTSTPTRRCSARGSTRCGRRSGSPARRSRRCATRSWRRSRRASPPRARRSTTSATPTASRARFQDRSSIHLREGEPCLRLRPPGAQAARRRARDLRLRALPAAAAAARALRRRRAARRGGPARSAAASS